MRLTQLTYVRAVLCLLLSSFLRPYGLWKWKLLSPVQLLGIPWDPMDYTVHEILQARILEGVGFPLSRGLPNSGIKSRSPALQADSLPAEPLWCWRRHLRVPWTAGRSNQSILKDISLEYSLEGLMLKLMLQYFGHLMQRTDLLKKIVMLGKFEGRRRRGRQRMS